MRAVEEEALLDRASTAARPRFPGARVSDLRRLPGGLSSLTFAAHLEHDAGASDVVLKVAPPGLPPTANRDVLRQARILDALADLPGVPVPAVLFRDAGEPPEIPPLVAMELASGEAYEPRIDVIDRPPGPEIAAERMRAAARALGRLHAPRPAVLGLDDEPVVAVGDEPARWARLFATIDDDIAPGHDDLARRLGDRVPDAAPPRLLHGDYRLGNMLFVGPMLQAVIDWEIWSVGDPRFDLAWLLIHLAPVHAFHADRPAADRAAGSRLPAPEALIGEYADGRVEGATARAELDTVTTDLGWFAAACHHKAASTVAAIWKRERRRPEPDPQAAMAADHLGALLEAGHRALDG